MRSRTRLLIVSLTTIVFVGGLSACGADEVTREQYLDHAVEFSTAATTDEQQADIRAIFDCVWPAISKDEELLGDFMDATESNPELSARVSKLMAPCIGAGSSATDGSESGSEGS